MLATKEVGAFCQPHLGDWLLVVAIVRISETFVEVAISVDFWEGNIADDTIEDDVDRSRLRHGKVSAVDARNHTRFGDQLRATRLSQ